MSKDPGRVHFVAIGGTGMGSLAGLLQARGISVSGSDEHLYPPMSEALDRWGIDVHRSFRAEHVLSARPDLVVIGNAVRADNPEAQAAIDEGFAYRSFPDALYELAIAGRHPVVVAGTHGKTTTTNLTAFLLHATGRDPSLLVGGVSVDFDGSFREGQGEHFVVEGDEYDSAFFDKTPKFLHYHARTLVITSVEFDHADIYRDLDHVKQAFRQLVADLPTNAHIVAAIDHPNVRDVVHDARCPVIGYGVESEDAMWCATDLTSDARGTVFTVQRGAERIARVRLPLHGGFNVENALAALVTAHHLGVTVDDAVEALPSVRGVKRRQEIRGEPGGIAVVDDFAHHPTAVAASLTALRSRFPGRRLLAVFEPRTNTSRRRIFQERYAEAFDGADLAIVRTVPDAPIYSATGDVTEFFSAEQLVRDLCARGVPSIALASAEEIAEHLVSECRKGDVVLVMSNGSFDGLIGLLIDRLGERAAGSDQNSSDA